MCEGENWSVGSAIALIVVVFVATGWFGPGEFVRMAPLSPTLLDSACVCFDPVCVCL